LKGLLNFLTKYLIIFSSTFSSKQLANCHSIKHQFGQTFSPPRLDGDALFNKIAFFQENFGNENLEKLSVCEILKNRLRPEIFVENSSLLTTNHFMFSQSGKPC
jgi:hypothetical protein